MGCRLCYVGAGLLQLADAGLQVVCLELVRFLLGLYSGPLCLSLEHHEVHTGGGVTGAEGEISLQGVSIQSFNRVSSKACHEELLRLYTVGCRIRYVEAGLLRLAVVGMRVLGLQLIRFLLALSYEQDARWPLRGGWCWACVRPSMFLHRRPISGAGGALVR